MLTVYSPRSSFKKKITVVVIWLVALALSVLLFEVIQYEGNTILTKVLPIILGLFMIAGILLRCKFARAFTLITLYAIALFPLVANFMLEDTIFLFSRETDEVFTGMEVIVSNVIWASLFIIPAYFFSNNKAMDIFFIESNPKEHILFVALSLILIFVYINYTTLPFL